jgi:eukaryotic-like serine/threonine-protein kinase
MSVVGSQCLQCGDALGAGAIEGFCQRCLAAIAFDTTSDTCAAAVETGTASKRRLGGYELIEEIGRGGMGVVYRARQIGLDREVAVKALRQGPFADAGEVTRFRREAAAAASLRHPNIVAVHEVGEADGHTYFSMDLVRGPTLAELVRDGAMEPGRAARCVHAIAEAVAAAHAQGILHRDLKPSNVIIDSDGEPRVTDFGLAKRLESAEATVTEQIAGSPAYMPPEQADPRQGGATVATDVYSLGALLYHLLTGRPPFQGETVSAILLQVQNAEPLAPRLLNPGLPRDLETISLKCLEKESSRRYASAQDLADELGRFLRNEAIVARPVSSAERLVRWCRRKPAVASLAASVFLLLVALSVGASIAAWRIEHARRGEHEERAKAIQANLKLAESVSFLELQRAEAFFRSGDASLGLAHLAAVLRRDPSNRLAAERILSALLHRNWVVPSGKPLVQSEVVHSVAFSPGGQFVVSGGADQVARVWDAATRTEITHLVHPDDVRDACFSPDETRVATACGDGYARIWNWRKGEVTVGPLKHDSFVMAVSFSPEGERIVTACGDGTATVWSTRTGESLLRLSGHKDELRQAVFSPDGRLIATAGYDGTVRLWNSRTGEAVGPVLRHNGWVLGAAFSPDGGRLATSSRDRTAMIWDWATGAPLLPGFRHPDGLNDVRFDPTGRILATTGFDSTVRLWDTHSGELLSQPFRHHEQVNQASFSPDGHMLATAADDSTTAKDDSTLKFWEIRLSETLKEPMRHNSARGELTWADFSEDGKRVVTTSSDATARIWDCPTARSTLPPLRHAAPVHRAYFSSDGRFLATACSDGSTWIWDARTGVRLKGPFQHAASVFFAAFSPDDGRLVTASADGTARVWDIESEQPVTPPLKHKGDVSVARFSPDGTRVATASDDNSARVWRSSKDGTPVTEILRHTDKVRDVQFSPDGHRVVTASMDNTARVWDVHTGKTIGRPLQHERTVQTAAFSPNGIWIVTASLDHTARVWDADTGEALTPPMEHDEGVTVACFSPDGRRVVTASLDRTARLWDAKSGLPISDPLRHNGPVKLARFSFDGERVITAAIAPDHAVRIWQIPTAEAGIPDWLPVLAETVAGLSVDPHGSTKLVPEKDFDALKQRLTGLTGDDRCVRVARWFFADRTTRTISPFQLETVPEYVQRRIAEDTLSSLEEAVRLDPTNGLALARLAKWLLPSDPAREARRTAEAISLAKRALRFAPDLDEARDVIERAAR